MCDSSKNEYFPGIAEDRPRVLYVLLGEAVVYKVYPLNGPQIKRFDFPNAGFLTKP
jgi:hypothetical protein